MGLMGDREPTPSVIPEGGLGSVVFKGRQKPELSCERLQFVSAGI